MYKLQVLKLKSTSPVTSKGAGGRGPGRAVANANN